MFILNRMLRKYGGMMMMLMMMMMMTKQSICPLFLLNQLLKMMDIFLMFRSYYSVTNEQSQINC